MATTRQIDTAARPEPGPVVGGAVFGLSEAALARATVCDLDPAVAAAWLREDSATQQSRERLQQAREWRARRKAELAASFLIQQRALDIVDLDELARALGIGGV